MDLFNTVPIFLAIMMVMALVIEYTEMNASYDLIKAIRFASLKHTKQRRKNVAKEPYINHPIRVCEILVDVGVIDIRVLQAALLHDTVEDTDTTLDEIEGIFGLKVRSLVAEASDDKSLPKETRKQLQIDTAAYHSSHAKLIKLADKIANLEDLCTPDGIPSNWEVTRVQEYFRWASKVADGLKGVSKKLDDMFTDVLKGDFVYHDNETYAKV